MKCWYQITVVALSPLLSIFEYFAQRYTALLECFINVSASVFVNVYHDSGRGLMLPIFSNGKTELRGFTLDLGGVAHNGANIIHCLTTAK